MHDDERADDPHQRPEQTIERARPWRRAGDPCGGYMQRPARSTDGWQRVPLEEGLTGNAVPGLQPRRSCKPAVTSSRATHRQLFEALGGLRRR